MIAYIIIAVAIVMIITGIAIDHRTKCLNKRRLHIERFYNFSKNLLDENRDETFVTDMIRFMSDQIDDPGAPDRLRQAVVYGPKVINIAHQKQLARIKIGYELFSNREPGRATNFNNAMTAAIFAISYKSWFLGKRIRKFTFKFARRQPHVSTFIAVDFKAQWDCAHHKPPPTIFSGPLRPPKRISLLKLRAAQRIRAAAKYTRVAH